MAGAAGNSGRRVGAVVVGGLSDFADGRVGTRERPEALRQEPQEEGKRVVGMLRENKGTAIDGSEVPIAADTICLHGDTPGAVEFARELRRALREMGVVVAAFEE